MSEKIWKCKIGGQCGELPHGADMPMRDAIALAFKEITGREPQFIFSGWGAELTEGERAVHENREASPEYYAKLKLEAAAPTMLAALQVLLPGLILDRRYADEDDDVDALNSRIETVTEAIKAATVES